MQFHIIVLAAGKGSRMVSDKTKVLHCIAGRTLIDHVLYQANQCAKRFSENQGVTTNITAVVASLDNDVAQHLRRYHAGVHIATQAQQLGTGHAVRCALQNHAKPIEPEDYVLVLFADTPLLMARTLEDIFKHLIDHPQRDILVLGMQPPNPYGYGRLVCDDDGALVEIVEQADLRNQQETRACNAGIMAFRGAGLHNALSQLPLHQNTGEYYLTDSVACIERARRGYLMIPYEEAMGVNTRADLANCEKIYQDRLRTKHLAQGVTMTSPETVFFAYDTEISADVTIEPHVIFGPGVKIEKQARVFGFSHIENTHVHSGASIGPFARLRGDVKISQDARIGNFVEVKKSTIGPQAKVAHLSYIGDTHMGGRCNIGAGTITCNYDGVQKHQTTIDEHVFVGSNVSLIAPVHLGRDSLVGAGSVIRKTVAPGALVVSRAPQREFKNKSPFKSSDLEDHQKVNED